MIDVKPQLLLGFAGFFLLMTPAKAVAQSVGDPCTGNNRVYSPASGPNGMLICNGATLELLETVSANPPRVSIGTTISSSAALTVSGGGISTGTSANTDIAGKLTLVSGVKSYTFTGTYTNPPICVVSSTALLPIVALVSTTATALTVTVPGGLNVDTYNYICIVRN